MFYSKLEQELIYKNWYSCEKWEKDLREEEENVEHRTNTVIPWNFIEFVSIKCHDKYLNAVYSYILIY